MLNTLEVAPVPAFQPSQVPLDDPLQVEERPLCGFERLWGFTHTLAGGAYDVVASFRLPRSTASTHTVSDWRRAWGMLASEQPLIHARFNTTKFTIECPPPSKVKVGFTIGHSVNTLPVASRWTVQDGIDLCLLANDFTRLQITLFHSPKDDLVTHVMLTCTHVLVDAGTLLKMMLRLHALLKRPSEPLSLVQRPPTRLPPSIYDALQTRPDDAKLQQWMQRAATPTHGLSVVPLEDHLQVRQSDQWRKVHTFDKDISAQLVRHCRQSGFSVTSFVNAAMCHALIAAKPPDSWPTTFTCPLQPVSKFDDASANGMLFSALAAIPVTWTVNEHDSVDDTARQVSTALLGARHECIGALDSYISTMLRFFEAQQQGKIPSPVAAFPTLNSLGNLGDGFEDVQMASRNNLPSLGCHAYTVAGHFNVSLAWCPGRFHDEELEAFWVAWIRMIEAAVGSAAE